MSRALKPRKSFQDYLREAKNPQTTGKRLESLFTHVPIVKGCAMTREKQRLAMHCAIARNPNTPPKTLQTLCNAGYLRDVRKNPSFALLAIEEPGVWNYYLQDLEASFSKETIETAWDKRSKNSGGVKVTGKDLTPFQELTERVFYLCIYYRIPIACLMVHCTPAIGANPNAVTSLQKPSLELSWRGYSRLPFSVQHVMTWLPRIDARSGREKDLSARITASTDLEKHRMTTMLTKEGFVPRYHTGLTQQGRGLQIHLSESHTFDTRRPVIYLRLTQNIEGDPHLFDNFHEWTEQ